MHRNLKIACLSFLTLIWLACSPADDRGGTQSRSEDPIASAEAHPAGARWGLGAQGRAEDEDPILVEREPWTGDLAGMVERRKVRALVVFSKTFYFLDGAQQKGASYEGLQLFEKFLNERFKTGARKINVIIIPVGRDELIPALAAGWGDVALANLTITPERLLQVDFSAPLISGVSEVIVTGPSGPEIETVEDLAGQRIHARRSSSYWPSLVEMNRKLVEAGLEEATLVPANENLEDEDLLEMVNAGLIETTVSDLHKALFWEQIFEALNVHSDLAVRTGGQIAWAVRKDAPQFLKLVSEFTHKNRKGTLMGNIIMKRYLQDTAWVSNSLSDQNMKRFAEMAPIFQQYAEEFDFDWLMVIAQAFQESGLDQSRRSRAGAIGVMQIKPSTANDPNVSIPEIEILENNIHAGVKYLRFIRKRYFENEPMDDVNKTLFSFAAYNAGPARIAGLRKRAGDLDLDPNVWFNNVELVASREIGRETVQYVANIFKYYIAYSQSARQQQRRDQAWQETGE